MYYQYFGLEEAPFSIAVNPRYLYMSPRHRDALAHLLYGVGAGGGFILLTGEVGTGKTTINRCLIEQLPDNADIAIVLNPALDARDLLAAVCEELAVEPRGDKPGLKELTDALHRFLLDNHSAGRKTVLMIDEAQHLGFAVLEQIRLLTNLETNQEKLLHIILIGQPELAQKLALPELRQLNQRITARFELAPLSRQETAAYVRHRLHVAGLPAGRDLFSPTLLRAVHHESRGVPRVINLICDRMLLGAYGQNLSAPDKRLLHSAVREVTGTAGRSALRRRWQMPMLGAVAALLVAASLGFMLMPGEPRSDLSASRERAVENTSAVATGPKIVQPSLGVPVAASTEPLRTTAAPADEVWRLSPLEGAQVLAALYSIPETLVREELCAEPLAPRLRCERRDVRSWNQLLEDGRPALLSLVDARRFESTVVFLGIDQGQALLASPTGLAHASLDALARQWSGAVWSLWLAPEGVRRVLNIGDRGADVAAVAQLFARLDGQNRPLTEDRFDAALEARTRLFQRRQGLKDDGVMGEQTLRALVLAAGEDLSMTEARTQLEARLAQEQRADVR